MTAARRAVLGALAMWLIQGHHLGMFAFHPMKITNEKTTSYNLNCESTNGEKVGKNVQPP